MTTDLLVRGGDRSSRPRDRPGRDVAVEGGRIAAVEPDLGALAASARRGVDATGLLVLPGVIDVHTHTRVATDEEPDRFFQDSVAAAFGGTTTFLVVQQPGHRLVGGGERRCARVSASGWRRRPATRAVDVGLSAVISAAARGPGGRDPAT